MISKKLFFALLLSLALLGGCASVPSPLTGNYAALTPEQVKGNAHDGTQVRWGGQIIGVDPQADETCIYVLSRKLDHQARPREQGPGQGRFVACSEQFMDPEVFTSHSDITFTGIVDGAVQRKVGKFDYTYPRITISSMHLWPERPVMPAGAPYYSPFQGPAPWLHDPFWYRSPAVRPVWPR